MAVHQVVASGDVVLCGTHAPGQLYVLELSKQNDPRLTISYECTAFKSFRVSLVHGGQAVLVGEIDALWPRTAAAFKPPDTLTSLSIAELSQGRWTHVGPKGEIVERDEVLPSTLRHASDLWNRRLGSEAPDNLHSSFCAASRGGLFLFDVRRPTFSDQPSSVIITEVTPLFDDAKGRWKEPKQIVRETSLSLGFSKEFHPYHVNGDFYLVTESGKVYSALKPGKDRPRSIVDMKLPFTVRYAVDTGNGVYHVVGMNTDGQWRYAKLGREPKDQLLNVSEGFDKLKPIKAAVEIVKIIKQDAAKK